MTCPVCGSGSTRITNSRHVDCETVRRRRECRLCGHRFSTEETEITEPVNLPKTGFTARPTYIDRSGQYGKV